MIILMIIKAGREGIKRKSKFGSYISRKGRNYSTHKEREEIKGSKFGSYKARNERYINFDYSMSIRNERKRVNIYEH